MKPINGENLARIDYFNLEEYVDRIKLSSDVLFHAYETSESFDKYIKLLSEYPDEIILKYLISCFERELSFTNKIEHHVVDPMLVNKNSVYFDSLSMNNQRIKNLHSFVMNGDCDFNYRNSDVNVSYFDNNGVEHIYWRGVEVDSIQRFMDDFIKIYKEKGLSLLDNNPFFKSSLMALLFVRIHPFTDGNGRTSRLIYDMKFTEMINKIYGSNLKISPLHLSNNLFINRYTYGKKINNIYFDLEHDSNDEINNWFDFMLNMVDEQLYFKTSDESKKILENINKEYNIMYEPQKEDANLMKLKKFK